MNIESRDIIKAVRESLGSISKAAVLLRVSRKTIYVHINKSNELRAAVDEIVKLCRDDSVKNKGRRRKIYADGSRTVSMNVTESEDGSILSTKMQKILYQTKGNYTSMYNLAFDQLSLRELMSSAMEKHNRNDLDFREYVVLMIQLHRTYGIVTKEAEDIAKMSLEGKAPSQVYDEMFHFVRNIIETFKELINDENVEREKIIEEFDLKINLKESEEQNTKTE